MWPCALHYQHNEGVSGMDLGNRVPVREGRWVTYDHRGVVSRSGTIVLLPETDVQSVVYVIDGVVGLKDSERALYVLDDGSVVVPVWVAGWPQEGSELWAQPFPVNDGSVRPDNGREVDFASWFLSPRRAYHLKVTWN